MNSRNLHYIRPYNRKRARKIADNKLLSKRILRKNKIPVPGLHGSIKNYQDLKNFDFDSLPKSFALKPNKGLGGEGIIVVFGKNKKGNWVKANNQEVTVEDLKNHILTILEGHYSLAGVPDTAFFEERVKISKQFKPYAYKGIPDIRVIVFNKVPVMAMLRLPTKESDGRANLHLGGVCAGIDLNTGVTTSSITKNLTTQKEYLIEYIPQTRLVLSGITIPFWEEILEIAVKAQQITNLGFLGIDIMLDREKGPVVAELNARPGLGIQNANLAPLKVRLEKIADIAIKSFKRGVRVGKDLFGGEIEEDIEDMTGKKILSIFEDIKIENPQTKKSKQLRAKIDTGAYSTSIASDVAKNLGFEEVVDYFKSYEDQLNKELNKEEARKIQQEIKENCHRKFKDLCKVTIVYSSNGISVRPKIKINLTIQWVPLISEATITDRKDLKYKVIVGRKDLRKFIVDPSKL